MQYKSIMARIEFHVTGMSCGHCEAAIREELSKIPGVNDVDVDATTGQLIVIGTELKEDLILQGVQEAGYSAVLVG